MDHDIDVEGRAASMTPTPDEGGSTTTAPAEQAPGRTSSTRRRRRGGRGRGRSRSATGTATAAENDGSGEAAPVPSDGSIDGTGTAEAPSETDDAARPKTQQRSGQPRRRRPAGATASAVTADEPSKAARSTETSGSDAEAEPAQTEASADAAVTPAKKRRRRRGGRGRSRRPATAATADGDEGEGPVIDPVDAQRDEAEPDADAAVKPAARRRRRSSSTRADEAHRATTAPTAPSEPSSPKPARSRPAKAKTVEEHVAAGGPTRGIRTTRTRTGRDGRRRREPLPTPPRVTDKLMVITERGDRDQIAVLEEELLVQHYVTRAGATSMVGNIYLGRVQNVLPGMEAAFVDVGRGRNGVLYAGEVNYSPEDIDGPAPRIEQLLKPGQAVMVQVTKDPMGGKGARLTANLSLAGRYLVLAPNQDLQGISRRLPDEARKHLKTLLKRVKPPEHGVIVRTAAESATEEALEADLRRLLAIWDQIQATATKGKAPTVLYEEPELTVRVVRDLFTDEEYRGLVTDSQRVHGLVVNYLREVAPDLADKVTLHAGPLPAFEAYRIVEQIHKALDRKVWLPSGGYLIIERTEAMTIIDVNTGKSVGKTNLEATVVNTNLEAAREVARQLRLRDIGGIIVIDFIDMLLEKNKKQVEDTMRDALAVDKTRSQVFEIGPLGLMQVTRKRVSSGLVESFSQVCPTCEGRGIILTYDVD